MENRSLHAEKCTTSTTSAALALCAARNSFHRNVFQFLHVVRSVHTPLYAEDGAEEMGDEHIFMWKLILF